MPLFEYACPRCGEKREVLSRSGEAQDAPRCSLCGASMEKEWAPIAAPAKGDAGGCGPSRGGFS